MLNFSMLSHILLEVLTLLCLPHTRTAVRESCYGDEASQWWSPKFDPSSHQNPL